MRIELDASLFLLCVIIVVLTWLITRNWQSRKLFILSMSFVGALLMPAFVPGHGELIMVLPNATMFTIKNDFSLFIGCFFLLVNFLVLTKVFGRISRKKAT